MHVHMCVCVNLNIYIYIQQACYIYLYHRCLKMSSLCTDMNMIVCDDASQKVSSVGSVHLWMNLMNWVSGPT